MKRSMAMATALGAISTATHAEEMMDGVVDAGALYKTGADRANDHQYQLVGGGEATNLWGRRGSEDSGGGLAATLNLEGGFKLDTGELTNSGQPPGTSAIFEFDRGATVRIRSDAGLVRAGRNGTPFYESLGASAAGWSNFGSLNNFAYQQQAGLAGAGYYWASNSVKYTMPAVGGFDGSLLYGFGEQPGSLRKSRLYSASLGYSNGPVRHRTHPIQTVHPLCRPWVRKGRRRRHARHPVHRARVQGWTQSVWGDRRHEDDLLSLR
ncbi:porin [Burkholderia pseudomallei]|uniref:porin n=1 Tax=Burkholderia pseudomallei TaxID=28450 RepID=UPI0004F58AD9|nr:porin [Burkholderia pseudomallei]AIP11083.1 gram-negative porin family protein [Burkholderia pseudomallei]